MYLYLFVTIVSTNKIVFLGIVGNWGIDIDLDFFYTIFNIQVKRLTLKQP